ncbi:MAG: aldo/keto reductase [Muribaculaceae bacterium]|nr:aldo/keto reductase [Muribaculaceae bacterium]
MNKLIVIIGAGPGLGYSIAERFAKDGFLACGKNGIFHNPLLTSIATAHGKSVAQIVLRWLYQRDIVIIPKSTHLERMIENFAILDLSLTDEEMSLITTLNKGKSLFNWW